MRQHWRLGHRSPELNDSEWFVTLSEEPGWTHVVENVWNGLCTVTRGWIGGHGDARAYNAVIWNTPVGRPRWNRSIPGDPWLENSLGSVLYRLENWILTRSHDHGRDLAKIDVAADVARQLDDEFVEVMESVYDEDPATEEDRGQ